METIFVDISINGINDIYEPNYISFGDGCVIGCDNSRNMGFLLGYCTKEQEEERKKPIQAEMDQYNDAVSHLWDIPGFMEFFAEHGSYVSLTDIESEFGKEAVEHARRICHITNCYPDLMVQGDVLRLRDVEFTASFNIGGDFYSFCVEHLYIDPFVNNKKICAYDRSSDGGSRVMAWLYQFYDDGVISGGAIDYELEYASYHLYGDMDSRYVQAIDYSINLLEKRGYLRKYSLATRNKVEVWNRNTNREDNTVLFIALDPKYKKDKLLCERLNCLWNNVCLYDEDEGIIESTLDLDKPFYFLQDNEDHTYLSTTKAAFGGHNKLKIYGRLDCPSANRYVKAGKYVQHRVFFADEDTAIQAGYRPCGVCMPEAYKKWKERNGQS